MAPELLLFVYVIDLGIPVFSITINCLRAFDHRKLEDCWPAEKSKFKEKT